MTRRKVLLAVVGLAGCGRFEEPIEKDLAAQDRWAELEATRERRLSLAAGLVRAARASAARDEPAVAEVAEARSRANLRMTGSDLADPMKVAALLRGDQALHAALGRLLELRAGYPGLWHHGELEDAETIEQELARARSAYDDAARAYNRVLAGLPRGAVNKLSGKRYLPRVVLGR